MYLNFIIGPLVGAVIGYITNKIAVEMLFHPIKPIYIGKFHVPFTPGIIPKGKERFGKAIGNVVGKNLLTPGVIKETLLADYVEQEIEQHLDRFINDLSKDESTLNSKMDLIIEEAGKEKLENKVVTELSERIARGLVEMNLGEIIAVELSAVVQEKIQGTMLAMFIKPSFLEPIGEEVKVRINQYVAEHGEEKVTVFIQEEYKAITDRTIASFLEGVNKEDLKKAILSIYRMAVDGYAQKLLDSLNLSQIVENKVNAMETVEVEKLVLSIMQKELGAVVNLGAFIGFLLGLINILI